MLTVRALPPCVAAAARSISAQRPFTAVLRVECWNRVSWCPFDAAARCAPPRAPRETRARARAQADAQEPPADGAGEGMEDGPQSTQDLTIFVRRAPLSNVCRRAARAQVGPSPPQVQNLLQQMQSRFATMSDAIIGRSARALLFAPSPRAHRPLARARAR